MHSINHSAVKELHTLSMNVVKFLQRNFELLFWLSALLLLYCMNVDDANPSLCFFRFAGIEHCPGCGIGHAINSALHFKFEQSYQQHKFGIPAVLIISHRIFQLLFTLKKSIT